jgi:hypothetical protein
MQHTVSDLRIIVSRPVYLGPTAHHEMLYLLQRIFGRGLLDDKPITYAHEK